MARHIALMMFVTTVGLAAVAPYAAHAESLAGIHEASTPSDRITPRDVCRAADRHASYGKSFRSRFLDPEDGAFDLSERLATRTGFLPIPVVITEPAVGLGGGLMAAFFHDTNKGPDGKTRIGPTGLPVAPSVSVIGGVVTENGTWGVFGGHLGIWKDDRIRYTGGAGYVSANLDYYGLVSSILGKPLSFNIEGFAFLQDIQFRIANSPVFVGARYAYFKNDVSFDRLLPIPGLNPIEFDSSNAGASLEVLVDTRDNMFTPNNGVYAKGWVTLYDEALGGDFSYVGAEAFFLGWKQVLPCLNLGFRLDLRHAEPGAPFWGLPFVDLRGVPAMRYQGNDVAVAETELRWDVTRRWSLVGFTGAGRAARDLSDLPAVFERRGEAQNAWNVGAGFRYLIARKLGLRMGCDIARGPEDWAFYITVGTSWLRF